MLTVIAIGLLSALALGLLQVPRTPLTVSRSEAVRRVLRHIARRPIAQLADADAAVVRGEAVAVDDPLVAPLSGRRCIGYHLLIRDRTLGEILVDHARCARFIIVDDTGEVLVRSEGLEFAAIEAPPMFVAWPLPPPIARWVPPSWRGKTVVITEGVLLPGAPVAACGVMQTTIAAGELYREGRAHRVLVTSPTFPLVASPDRDLEEPSPNPVRPEELRDLPAS
ncbi:MAG TPA: hypothetical protein VFD36_32085 [Kofleriaceae bacterium]|jgi:hypothetical protein|nr:hypothetical protein [Kofleriaceae bacterium]